MDIDEARNFIAERHIEIDPTDGRDVFDIGLILGVFELIHLCDELSGTFNRTDIAQMRRTGRIVSTVAFGQSVNKVVVKQGE